MRFHVARLEKLKLVCHIPGRIELTPYVGMSLAVEIVSKSVLTILGVASVNYLVVIVLSVGMYAECVPAVAPSAVEHRLVSFLKCGHDLVSLLPLCEVCAVVGVVDGMELDLDVILNVKLNEKGSVPAIALV